MSVDKIRNWAWPYIKNFRTYIDVGANDGDTSFDFISDFQKVIAFEPNPNTFKILSSNLQIESYNFALGSSSGNIRLIIPKDGKEGWGSTSELRNKSWTDGTVYNVEIKTLDSFNFQEVDFIKIDVEQAEMEVVLGAVETIKKNLPVIMFENKRHENDNVIDFLKNIGYEIEWHKSDTVAYYKE